MLPNELLSVIKNALVVGDWGTIRSSCQDLQLLIDNGEKLISWGWNGFITKKQFDLLMSVCPHCSSEIKVVKNGIFGFNTHCRAIETGTVCICIQKVPGNTIEDSIMNFLSAVKL